MAKKAKRQSRKSTVPRRDPGSAYRMSAEQVEHDLISGQNANLLQEYFGEANYQELRGLAREARRAPVAGQRVYILPGIMGSQIGAANDVIWIDPFDIRRGRLVELALKSSATNLASLGVIPLAYMMIKFRLRRAGFDADFFDYDWRQSLDQLGTILAQRIKNDSAHELSLVAHSMGGLVARAALKKAGAKVKRLIMLGTPNYGSFMPIQAMRGTYTLLQRVAAFDKQNTAVDLASKVVVTWRGLCQMLPSPQKFSAVNLYDAHQWPAGLPAPSQAILDQARQVQTTLSSGDDRCFLIAGVNRYTVVSVRVEKDERQQNGKRVERQTFVERLSPAGDGTVPLDLARLDGAKTYYVEEDHGSLQNNRRVTDAVIDLLDQGETAELKQDWQPPRLLDLREHKESERLAGATTQAVRKVEDTLLTDLRHLLKEVAAPPEPEQLPVPVAAPLEGLEYSLSNVVVGRRTQHRLDLRLAGGSIADVNSRAVVLGVFRDVAPSGPALALDERLDGAITEFTRRRMFSADVGKIFIMPTGGHPIRAEHVLFAGLGAFDRLDDSVQQLVAENTIRTFIRTRVEEFATVLIGSGSGSEIGRSLENLLKGFIRGLRDADTDHHFRGITLCELDPQRYSVIKQELYRLAGTSLFQSIEVTFDETKVSPLVAPTTADARRIPPRAKEPIYLIVRQESRPVRLVEREKGKPGRVMVHEAAQTNQPVGRQTADSFLIRASLLTAGGKATVISDLQEVNGKQLDALLRQINSRNFSYSILKEFGQQLARLVLPSTVLEALATLREHHLVVVNDAPSSRIPWETLRIDTWSPAAEQGLSRRYLADNISVAKWLEDRRLGPTLSVLLVVNPTGDLEGADHEGNRIRGLLKANPAISFDEIHRDQATYRRLHTEFSSGKYDLVHYAGHAFFDEQRRARSGIICADDKVLSGADLAGLSKLPCLVFFNACEVARIRGRGRSNQNQLTIRQQIDRNVSFAEAYLRGGVANYIGTYWPVNDNAAEIFADSFYRGILKGQSLGDALLESRKRVEHSEFVDWADYIHYGDPDFQLKLPSAPTRK